MYATLPKHINSVIHVEYIKLRCLFNLQCITINDKPSTILFYTINNNLYKVNYT